ncbi:MAG TPA: hypothetical protein ENH82_04715, partial [bacterium]|nr:hypothetical protein [bacterium]
MKATITFSIYNIKERCMFNLRREIVFLLNLLILFVFCTTTAHTRYNPKIRWRTVRKKNFTIYYPEGHEEYARRVLSLSDEVYRDVTGYLDVKPQRIPIVLDTDTDMFNGFYAPFPNRISLFETPPYKLTGFGSSLSDVTDLLFTHEYTHFAHITSAHGIYRFVPRIFGKDLGILNGLSPGWIIEGITTNSETMFTDGGRGRSPSFSAELRSFTGKGSLWSRSAAGTMSHYSPPGGRRIYLSGYYMVEYLNRIYGDDAIARLSRYQSKYPIFGTSSALRHVTKKSSKNFYSEFLDDFISRSDSIKTAANSKGLPAGRTIINHELDEYRSHFWTKNGTIMALRSGFERPNALVEIDPEKGEVLQEIKTGIMLNTEPVRQLSDGRLYFGEFFMHPLGYGDINVSDLVIFDPKIKKHKRLTRNERIFSADMSPDGTTFVAARRADMWIELVLLDADGTNIRPLVSKPGLYFQSPCWSPDGKTIAVSVKSVNKLDIALVDPNTGDIRTLFAPDIYGDNDPSFSPDGRWIVFTSSRDGIWNIYAWNIDDSYLYQLTSVTTGAYEPRVSHDGSILSFLVISGGTKEIRVMPFEPEAGRHVSVQNGSPVIEYDNDFVQPSLQLKSSDIPLWEAYKPFVHAPYVNSDEKGAAFGIMLIGQDPVELNRYQANIFYGAKSGRPGYSLAFTNNSLWPSLNARIYDMAENKVISGHDKDIWTRERGAEFSMSLNVIHRVFPSTLSSNYTAGVQYRKFDGLDSFEVDSSRNGAFSTFGETLFTHTPDTAPRSMVASWGQMLFFHGEKYIKKFGGEITGHNIQIMAKQFIPSPVKHHGIELTISHHNQEGTLYFDKEGYIPRGFEVNDTEGGLNLRKTLCMSLEYRYPIWFLDRGLGLYLLHAHLLRGSL